MSRQQRKPDCFPQKIEKKKIKKTNLKLLRLFKDF